MIATPYCLEAAIYRDSLNWPLQTDGPGGPASVCLYNIAPRLSVCLTGIQPRLSVCLRGNEPRLSVFLTGNDPRLSVFLTLQGTRVCQSVTPPLRVPERDTPPLT
jgi:hypothetical protein